MQEQLNIVASVAAAVTVAATIAVASVAAIVVSVRQPSLCSKLL